MQQAMKFGAEHILWAILKMSLVEKPVCLFVIVDFPNGMILHITYRLGVSTYKAFVVQ